MAVTQLLSKIQFNNTWTSVDLDTYNQLYLIAVKQTKASGDTVDPADVDAIYFEVALESGVTNKYLTLNYIKLDFNEITSSDDAFNKISAFVRLLNMPTDFYIRPAYLITKNGEKITTGQTTIKVSAKAVELGAN